MPSRSARWRWQIPGQVSIHVVLVLLGALFVLPFLYMFLASFKPALEIIKMPPTFLPRKFTLLNYATVFERLRFWRYFINSVITSGGITALAVFSSSLAGFVFTKFKFPGRELVFVLFLAGLMIPFSIIVMPLYLLISKAGMQNSYFGLILPLCVSPFGIFLMRQFMEGIPNDMVEAARMDGANNMWIYSRVMFRVHGGDGRRGSVHVPLVVEPALVASHGGIQGSHADAPAGDRRADVPDRQALRHDRHGGVACRRPGHGRLHFRPRTLIKGMMLTGLKM